MGVIFFCLATQVYSMLEDGRQGYFRCCQISKRTCAMFDDNGHQQTALLEAYMDRRESQLTDRVIKESYRMVN